jgi:hypothetical protein
MENRNNILEQKLKIKQRLFVRLCFCNGVKIRSLSYCLISELFSFLGDCILRQQM